MNIPYEFYSRKFSVFFLVRVCWENNPFLIETKILEDSLTSLFFVVGGMTFKWWLWGRRTIVQMTFSLCINEWVFQMHHTNFASNTTYTSHSVLIGRIVHIIIIISIFIEFQSLNHLASIYIVRNLCFIVCSCYESSKSSIISSEFMLNCFARNCPCHFMVIIALLFRLKRFFQSSHHGIFTLSLSYWPFLQSIKHSLFFTRFIVLSAFFFIITDCIHFQSKKKCHSFRNRNPSAHSLRKISFWIVQLFLA